jgi:hypothetical protein
MLLPLLLLPLLLRLVLVLLLVLLVLLVLVLLVLLVRLLVLLVLLVLLLPLLVLRLVLVLLLLLLPLLLLLALVAVTCSELTSSKFVICNSKYNCLLPPTLACFDARMSPAASLHCYQTRACHHPPSLATRDCCLCFQEVHHRSLPAFFCHYFDTVNVLAGWRGQVGLYPGDPNPSTGQGGAVPRE